jgi:uncharacterized membrane protein YhaH (DUF805 family)
MANDADGRAPRGSSRGIAMEYVLMPLKRFADFSGRSRRKEFWSYILFIWVATFVLMYLDSALGLGGTATSYSEAGSVGFNMSGGLLTILFVLATIVPNLAVSVRRLHDVGKSGWMLLIGLIPLVGWIYLIVQYVQPGTIGANPYGPDPKGEDVGKAFA